jgi:hypothetical protein
MNTDDLSLIVYSSSTSGFPVDNPLQYGPLSVSLANQIFIAALGLAEKIHFGVISVKGKSGRNMTSETD